MTDHDRLFKELLRTFFWEFLELFVPTVLPYLERESITFLDKEIFTDVTLGDRHQVDLLAQGKFRDEDLCFLLHLEQQAQPMADFDRRMFHYFARLHQTFDLPIYPIALFSFAEPLRAEPDQYLVQFPDLDVLRFQYRTIQLNRLDWRAFLKNDNPVASALMARMRMEPGDRPKVKAQCLRMLARLSLDPARSHLISGFVDTYLRLNAEELSVYDREVEAFPQQEQEAIVQFITTSWMEEGLIKGREEGIQKGREEGREAGLQEAQLSAKRDAMALTLEIVFGEQAKSARVAQASLARLAELEAMLRAGGSLTDCVALLQKPDRAADPSTQ